MINLSKRLCKICDIEPEVNFEHPENFVYLQKIIIEGGVSFDIKLSNYPTILQISFYWDDEDIAIYDNSLEKVFLRFVIQISEIEEYGYLKQSIRQMKWKYE